MLGYIVNISVFNGIIMQEEKLEVSECLWF